MIKKRVLSSRLTLIKINMFKNLLHRFSKRNKALVLWFNELGIGDVGLVGGKNASLGEMVQHLGKKGVPVPNGFAITAYAYHDMLEKAGLKDDIRRAMAGVNVKNMASSISMSQLILKKSLTRFLFI